MRRALALWLAILLSITMAGCGGSTASETSSTTPIQSSKENKNTAATTVNAQAGTIVEGWPIEVPLIQGIVVSSSKSPVLSSDLELANTSQYTTCIDTNQTNAEAIEFYKSRFHNIIDEGFADANTGSCTGKIGDWKVVVYTSSKPYGGHQVTVTVRPITSEDLVKLAPPPPPSPVEEPAPAETQLEEFQPSDEQSYDDQAYYGD